MSEESPFKGKTDASGTRCITPWIARRLRCDAFRQKCCWYILIPLAFVLPVSWGGGGHGRQRVARPDRRVDQFGGGGIASALTAGLIKRWRYRAPPSGAAQCVVRQSALLGEETALTTRIRF